MNIKTLAAVVGTLSLGSLATGCATAKSADAGASTPAPATTEKGAQASCSTKAAPEKGTQASCSTSAQEKGSQMSCGSSGCGGKK